LPVRRANCSHPRPMSTTIDVAVVPERHLRARVRRRLVRVVLVAFVIGLLAAIAVPLYGNV